MREEDARRARAPDLRLDRRLGHLLRRQGRHHPPRGRRAPAGPEPRVRARRLRRGDRGLLRGPRHRHRGRRRHRDRGAVRAPGATADPDGRAGRDQLHQGQHRPHQGRRRRGRADQGGAGGAPPGDPAGHRPRTTRTRCSPSDDAALYVPREAELWPAEQPIRAGVSAMGFGGINTHIVLEQAPGADAGRDRRRRTRGAGRAAAQDAELLLLDGADVAELRERVDRLADASCRSCRSPSSPTWRPRCAGELSGGPVRAAVVATEPGGRRGASSAACSRRSTRASRSSSPPDGVFLGHGSDRAEDRLPVPRPGFGPRRGGAIRRRFAAAEDGLRRGRRCPPAATRWPPRSPSRASSPAPSRPAGAAPRWASRPTSRSGTASAS